MEKDNSIKLFEEKFIRTHWDADKEKWYFSIVDVVAVLTGSENPRHYWTVLKGRLNNEGNETVTNCERLKMKAPDGKMRMTDVANTEQLLRLIQSIPSKKAEPFGSVVSSMRSLPTRANQSLKIAIDRALETYLKKGYSRDWINQRLK
ncbi:MAG: phage antirepressor protein, partial [Gracilibacteraceae bacterium]|nr:phage antirepressor protein [Gracilibacteraceae bacterium]